MERVRLGPTFIYSFWLPYLYVVDPFILQSNPNILNNRMLEKKQKNEEKRKKLSR